MDFLAMDKIFCHGQKNFVQDNLGFVLDKNYFVHAEGRGNSWTKVGRICGGSEMAQSCHFKKWGRDNSFTSGEAASKGIKISPFVTKGTV